MTEAGEKAVIDLLQRLVCDVTGLRAEISRVRGRTRILSREDRALLDRLLPAVYGALGDATWSAADLFAHADLDARLGSELVQILGVQPNRKAFGKLLSRAEGSAVGGFEIHRATRLRAGIVWRLSARL